MIPFLSTFSDTFDIMGPQDFYRNQLSLNIYIFTLTLGNV